ncbi:MAG TPA: AMP-binding protein [Acidimicrobiales bacterium]|nr:AMP-binding protein [Acidimicrobiales bacterium]
MPGQVGSHPRGVAAVAAAAPDRPAVIDGQRLLTFQELDGRANTLAVRLAEVGIEPGQAVGVLMANRAEWFVVSHAVARLGGRTVPISPRLTAGEVGYIARDSGMRVCCSVGAMPYSPDEVAIVDVSDPGLAETTAEPPRRDYLCTPPSQMGYTSGTTGRPKGVERPTPAPYPVAVTSPVATFWGYRPETVQLVCGPLYHTAPSAYAEYALWEGGRVVVQDGFDGGRCLSLIEAHRVTHTQMVPAHFVRILEADWAAHDRSSLRLVLHAAASCPVPVKWRILEVFPSGTVWELYGATEALATVISPGEWILKPGSVGRAFPGLEVRVLDDEGRPAPPGEIGTIYVSLPPSARFAYRGDPEKTAAAYRDGFVTVGDLGHLDQDGYLFIADRRTDLIVTGGVNVYPAEVESALAADPDVVDSAVIGLPDDRMGQRVHAIVELRPGAGADPEALLARLADRLADFKRPRTVELVATLPREPDGKVRKGMLRAERGG